MEIKKKFAMMLVLFAIPIVFANPQFTILSDNVVDNPFSIVVGVNETIEDFRGLTFGMDYNSNYVKLINVDAYDAYPFLYTHYNNKNVAFVSSQVTDLSDQILVLDFEVLTDAGKRVYLNAENGEFSIQTDNITYELIDSATVEVTLSSCVKYDNTHSENDGLPILPGTSCYCNNNYVPTPDTLTGWSCKPTSYTIQYGNNTQSCTLGGVPIYSTGFCCKTGYIPNPLLTADNFASMLGQGVDVCIVKPNDKPIANIYSPDDNEEYKVGKRLKFDARGSWDPEQGQGNCTDCKYEWDFGDRTEPWGTLQLDSNDDIICKSRASSKKCDENDAEVIGDVDEDAPNNPCVCTEYEDYVYPRKDGKTEYYTYDDEFVCTEYEDREDGDLTNECRVYLYVTDAQNATTQTHIDIELYKDSSSGGGSTPFCGNKIVEGAEACDGNPSAYCDSTVCNADCTCYVVEDIPIVEQPPVQAICGNMRCEVGETATACMSDCHCGNGVCQVEYGETADNCSDCDEETGGGSWMFILIGLIIIGGFLFALKQGYISLDKIIPKLSTGGIGNSPEFNLDQMAHQHNVHQPHTSATANLSKYIQSTRAKGYSYSQIRNTLLNKGWSEDSVNSVFSKLNQ